MAFPGHKLGTRLELVLALEGGGAKPWCQLLLSVILGIVDIWNSNGYVFYAKNCVYYGYRET